MSSSSQVITVLLPNFTFYLLQFQENKQSTRAWILSPSACTVSTWVGFRLRFVPPTPTPSNPPANCIPDPKHKRLLAKNQRISDYRNLKAFTYITLFTDSNHLEQLNKFYNKIYITLKLFNAKIKYTQFYIRISKSGPGAQVFLISKLFVTLLWWVGHLLFG